MTVQMQHMIQQLRLRLSFCLSHSPTLPTSAIAPLQSTAAAPKGSESGASEAGAPVVVAQDTPSVVTVGRHIGAPAKTVL